MGYERDNIARLAPYVPGEQPVSTEPIKLNTNENPFPPPEAVMRAIHEVQAEAMRRYPPPTAAGLREAAAEAHTVSPDRIIATHGGDELLRLAITVFTEPDENRPGGHDKQPGDGQGHARAGLGLTEPTYSLYHVLAQIHDCAVTTVGRGEDFSLPEDLADRWNDAGCHLAMLVNPHAPSGRLEDEAMLRRLAERFRGVLLIDEAYVDFAERDAIHLVRGEGALDNVLLLRSLSKGYSLAGLRVGYGIGHPALIGALDKARDSYNLDALAQAGATAALEHRESAQRSWRAVITERERLAERLRDLGFAVPQSHTNFLLVTPPGDGPDAASLYESLKSRAVYVRYFNQPRLHDKLRITVGRAEQNDALLNALTGLMHVSNQHV